MRVVTSQATEIRNMTIGLVILACVIVVIVGIFITAGIENNMRRISRKFGDVAKGDLTVTVSAKGHDEFQDLAGSATNMITNTKKPGQSGKQCYRRVGSVCTERGTGF